MQKVKKGVPYAKGLVVKTLFTVSEETALLMAIFSPLVLILKKDVVAKSWLTALLHQFFDSVPQQGQPGPSMGGNVSNVTYSDHSGSSWAVKSLYPSMGYLKDLSE